MWYDKILPMISYKHLGVATVGDAAIPENAIVGELNLITVILLLLFAKITLQTRSRQTPHSHSVPYLKLAHIASHLCYQSSNFMPTLISKKKKKNYHLYSKRDLSPVWFTISNWLTGMRMKLFYYIFILKSHSLSR